MDPLSILASMAGLLMAAGTISTTLTNIKASIGGAPKLVDRVIYEVNDFKNALAAIEHLLRRLSVAPRKRTALIQVDQIVATLTEAVLTLSELEEMIAPIKKSSEFSIAELAPWFWKAATALRIMERLQCHKTSLLLMLNIVQCQSDIQAEQSCEALQRLVERLLESNRDIARRLYSFETSYNTQSSMSRCSRNDISIRTIREDREDRETITSITSQTTTSTRAESDGSDFYFNSHHLKFEDVLEDSRVYKRTQHYQSDVSFTSSNARTHAWSVFSGFSLAAISAISAIALPIYPSDLPNSQWYKFEESAQRVSQSGTGSHVVAPILSSSTSSPGVRNSPADDGDWRLSFQSMNQCYNKIEVSPMEKFIRNRKAFEVLTLGDESSGIASLIVQLFPSFKEPYNPTNINSCRKQAVIDGESCILEVQHTVGQEKYTAFLHHQAIRGSVGFLILYRVTSRLSFDAAREAHRNVQIVKNAWRYQWVPIMLVGNNLEEGVIREVSTYEGQKLARELDCEFVEISPKSFNNVEDAFYGVVRSIRKQRTLQGRSVEKRLTYRQGPV